MSPHSRSHADLLHPGARRAVIASPDAHPSQGHDLDCVLPGLASGTREWAGSRIDFEHAGCGASHPLNPATCADTSKKIFATSPSIRRCASVVNRPGPLSIVGAESLQTLASFVANADHSILSSHITAEGSA